MTRPVTKGDEDGERERHMDAMYRALNEVRDSSDCPDVHGPRLCLMGKSGEIQYQSYMEIARGPGTITVPPGEVVVIDLFQAWRGDCAVSFSGGAPDGVAVQDVTPALHFTEGNVGIVFTHDGADFVTKVMPRTPRLDFNELLTREYRVVPSFSPGEEWMVFTSGVMHFQSGQHQLALERFDNVLELNPGSIEARLWKGRVFHARGELDEAAHEYQTVLASEGAELRKAAQEQLVQIYFQQKKFSQCVSVSDELLDADDSDAVARWWRGMAKEALGQRGAALEDFEKLVTSARLSSEQKAEVLGKLAALSLAGNDRVASLRWFDQLVVTNRVPPGVIAQRGLLRIIEGLAGGEQDLEQAVQQCGDRAEAAWLRLVRDAVATLAKRSG